LLYAIVLPSIKAKVKDHIPAGTQKEDDVTATETTKTIAERHSRQADALRQLTRDNPPSALTGSPAIHTSAGAPAPSISLAAFMGGRATGPRLNKHAPQQDGYDASQFELSKPDRAPHPTFGGRGVELPGMAQRSAKANDKDRHTNEFSKPDWSASSQSPKDASVADTSFSTNQSKNHTPIIRAFDLRERTKSTPSFQSATSWNREKGSTYPHPVIPTPAVIPAASGTNQDDNFSRRSSAATASSKPNIQSESPHQTIDGVIATPQKSLVTVNSLVRPIRPQPRVSSSLPPTPPSQTPSPAFLRPPPQKDPTPSIGRLQGRGFVRSMVKVSTLLESPPTSSDRTPEKGSTSGGRRVSVLDRWQPNNSPRTSSPPASPTPRPIRRSVTADPNPGIPQPAQTPPITKPLKPATSVPSVRQTDVDTAIPVQTYNKQDGLGSATTLLVYKPKLTDPPSQPAEVDELGFQKKSTGTTSAKSLVRGTAGPPASVGSPLSYVRLIR
jgi:hypothetical protein